MTARLSEAFENELRAARSARLDADFARAWRHLERAHILSQAHAWRHVRVHGLMFHFAWCRGNSRELLGQIPRLLLAAPGSWMGLSPRGNTGGSNVGLFAPMPIPDELESLLNEP